MILVVDDTKENIFALKSLLETNDFEVDTATTGEEALVKVLKNSYALIILDVQMPKMDGFEVAEAISGYSKAKHTPIIFLSAVNTHKKFITKGYTSGGIDYLTKPVDPDIFLLKVKTLYRLYEQTNALNEAKTTLQREVEVRKKAELALSNTVEELHSILEAIPQIAFTAKVDGEIEYVNERWYDYSESKNVFPTAADENINIASIWETTVKLQKELELEVEIKKIDQDEYRYHLLQVKPVFTENKISKWVGTFTDIHHQKMLNDILEQRVIERTAKLLEANKDLEASNHDLQQFASVASHDLKEPLRKIQVFSNIIKEQIAGDNTTAGGYLHKVILSAERMSRLINDLLNYSRLSEANHFEKVDLNKVVTEIASDLELLISEKKATVKVENLPEIDAVPGLIRQLFQNLITNALKFCKADIAPIISIRSEARKPVGSSDAGDHKAEVNIIVQDNGIGFDDKYVDKIFTLFQRLNSRDKFEGTGIGLAIAKKIVEKHRGKITAKSKENEGASFILTLPLRQEDTRVKPELT